MPHKGLGFMDLSTLIVTVFCLVDDWLKGREEPRRRGPKPELSDSEVLTIEIMGDRNYWSPDLNERLDGRGLTLLAPYKSKKNEKEPWPRWLTQKRRRIETVISQLVERYGARKVWARDRWHLTSRWFRKVLSHTVAFHLCQRGGLPSPLRFAGLVID